MANSDMGWQRRTKHFKRQSRMPDEQNIRKQTSEPLPPTPAVSKAAPTLQKHESYPQYNTSKVYLNYKILSFYFAVSHPVLYYTY